MKSGKPKRTNLLVAGIFLLIILSFLGMFGIFGGIISVISYPIQGAYQAISRGINSIYFERTEQGDTQSKILELEAEVKNLSVDYVELSALREENELLKNQINYLETEDFNIVSARVVTYINSPNEKILIINKGLNEGLVEGQPVMSGEGLIVGRISKVQNRIAEVRLITDPRSKIPVKILAEDKTIGIASGSYGSILKMELIPAQEKIFANDLVVTSNLELNIPSNLIVGLINEIHISGNEPFKSALVEPMANFYNLTIVSVIVSYNE